MKNYHGDDRRSHLESFFEHCQFGDKVYARTKRWLVSECDLPEIFAEETLQTFCDKWHVKWREEKTFDLLRRLKAEAKNSPWWRMEDIEFNLGINRIDNGAT